MKLIKEIPFILKVLELRNIKVLQKVIFVDCLNAFAFLYDFYSVEVLIRHFDYLFPHFGIVNFGKKLM
jgi:hypothetical protein